MQFRRLIAYIGLMATAASTHSAPQTGSYYAEVHRVHAPNVLRLVPEHTSEHFFFEMVDLDYDDIKDVPCTTQYLEQWRTPPVNITKAMFKKAKKQCRKLSHLLKGKSVEVQITDWNKPVLKGYLEVNGRILNLQLIEQGIYRADPTQTRSEAPFILEKKARCAYRGIWKDLKGLPAEQLKCNL